MGMKREAVQEERQRTKERDTSEVESTSNSHSDMPIERILEAERRIDGKLDQHDFEVCFLLCSFMVLYFPFCTLL